MSNMKCRINVTLPTALIQEIVATVGPRGKSEFIARAIQDKLIQIRRRQLQAKLEEGYKARRLEGLEITRTFEAADLEGLDEDY